MSTKPVTIEDLTAQIIAADKQLKKDGKILENMKKDLLGMLQSENIGGVNVKEGKVTVCTRTSKDYGESVKNLEANLKAEKTRLDYLGEYTINSVTHYLRID
jgi:septum formation topological specificity factor MinE